MDCEEVAVGDVDQLLGVVGDEVVRIPRGAGW